MSSSYSWATGVLTDRSANKFGRTFAGVIAFGLAPFMLLEETGRAGLNVPYHARQAGQYAARFNLAKNSEERVEAGLNFAINASSAIAGTAPLIPTSVSLRPVYTAQELAQAQYTGAAATAAAKNTYLEGAEGQIVNTGSAAGTGEKLSFDKSLNVVDRVLGREAGSILAENGVGRASYARLQAQGTEVRFVNDAGMPEMGLFNPYDNTVTVNMLRHTSANEVASTVVHEAVHQSRFFRSNIAPTTQYEEYLAFRNEYIFSESRRPSLFERQQITERVQELYPHLPSGKKPFGG